MEMNKRGIFFTTMVIVILSLFFITYTMVTSFDNSDSVRDRIDSMNSYVSSVEEDLARQLYIAGFRSIFIMEKRIVESGSYIANVNQSFQDLFFKGELNGNIEELMFGATFSDIKNSIISNSKKLNLNASFSSPVLVVTQDDPWNVKFMLLVDLLIEDSGGEAKWQKRHIAIAYVPVTAFEDPLYVVSTNGFITNNITKTPYTDFVVGTNVSNLYIHAAYSYYKNSTKAPSFLKRLEGNISADINGIESFVNLARLSDQGISVSEKSVVDYIYFSGSNPVSHRISGMQPWFRLDTVHLDDYGVSGLVF